LKENFDRFNFFQKFKEKEMNFRRVLTALALIAVFTALASAQIPVTQTMSCAVSPDTTPSIRAEGKTELVGNLVITCTGGPTPTDDAILSKTSITVDFGVPVTSRVNATGQSEVLLTIDAPGTVLPADSQTPNFGPSAPVLVCTNYTLGCDAFANEFVTGVWTMTAAAGGATTGANVYVGQIDPLKPNQVTFVGVPVLPVANVSFQRVYKVVNARVNPGSTTAITATATVKAATGALMGLTLTNSSASVATAATSLTSSLTVRGASLCAAEALVPGGNQLASNLAIFGFKEGFASAFKTLTNESGTVVAGVPVSAAADSPTRFKAVFANVPANVTLYVSLNPVADYSTPSPSATAVARLLATQGVAGETQAAGNFALPFGTLANGAVPVAPVTINAKTKAGEVIWEVTAAAKADLETFNFAVYAVYDLLTPPAIGNAATAVLGYAPTEIIAVPADVSATWIPRFAVPSAAAQPFLNILPCQTSLLFPYVTNVSGWETGIAISNTGSDPFNTVGKTGDCTLNFYGTNAPAAAVSFGTAMAPGSTVANTLSGLNLVNFSGYGVAVCTFQYAHGFAFINDGKQNMAMGYLASVMADTNRGLSLLGESFGQ
jgi:hypothetical protein